MVALTWNHFMAFMLSNNDQNILTTKYLYLSLSTWGNAGHQMLCSCRKAGIQPLECQKSSNDSCHRICRHRDIQTHQLWFRCEAENFRRIRQLGSSLQLWWQWLIEQTSNLSQSWYTAIILSDFDVSLGARSQSSIECLTFETVKVLLKFQLYGS